MGAVGRTTKNVVLAPYRIVKKGVDSVFGSDAAPKPPPLPALPGKVPTLADVDAGEAAALEKSLARTRKGRKSTFLGDLGVVPGDGPKTFLGGGG